MPEPWSCPVCRRGVRADVATCDHGGLTTNQTLLQPFPGVPLHRLNRIADVGGCPACDFGNRVCGCTLYGPSVTSIAGIA